MKEQKNVSALLFDAFTKREDSVVQFGVELKNYYPFLKNELVFELDELDRAIFVDFYRKLPVDNDKKFKIRLEYEGD